MTGSTLFLAVPSTRKNHLLPVPWLSSSCCKAPVGGTPAPHELGQTDPARQQVRQGQCNPWDIWSYFWRRSADGSSKRNDKKDKDSKKRKGHKEQTWRWIICKKTNVRRCIYTKYWYTSPEEASEKVCKSPKRILWNAPRKMQKSPKLPR